MKQFIAMSVDHDANEVNALCLINANDHSNAVTIYEQEERENFSQDLDNDEETVENMVSQSMETLEVFKISDLHVLGKQSENEDVEKPKVTRDEIKTLIIERGLTIEQVIEACIEVNGLVGVGIISLGDELKRMTYNKSSNNAWRGRK